MEAHRFTALAREAWDEAAPIHWQHTQRLVTAFENPQTSFVTPIHAAELARAGLEGAEVAQLNCNNGRELISMTRLGARRGVGFDISTGFVDQARRLAEAAGAPCTFEATDVYEISGRHDGRFDLVVVTSGALCFMPDLDAYVRVAKRLLKPGGRLNIYDCHPIIDMLELDRDRGERPVAFVRSYFDKRPLPHRSGLDYVGGSTYDAKEIYYFHYTLEDILSAVLGAGLRLETFKETGEDPSHAYPSIEASEIKPPLSFMLTARAG
ncbi:class I SAM-dependent methyltransferase [Salinarimonas chemoclinalis]|uniref:class I SAM-dependent methyltransferase n=1 Tax=Salinarimonas chemoclinalis TaxID=3241599 RepID=UPI003558DCDC